MGNWVNKEWSQIETLSGDEELDNITKKMKLKLPKKRSSLTNSNDSSLSNKSAILENETTPANINKMLLADFDPRSPSNEIVRTPICLADDKAKKLSITNGTKIPTFDPRSPTNEYNRTPIHVAQRNTDTNTNENESNSLNGSLNVSVNSFSLDSSSMAASDSSMLLQQIPEGCLSNTSNLNASSNDTPSKLQKLIISSLPRHILQRKQVAKLNKKKLIEKNDKENVL